MPEVETLPACGHYGIGVAPYSPIARGVPAGKYRPGEVPPADSRAARDDRRAPTLEQMRAYLDGAGFVFGAEDESLINSMVSPGHPSTPGYNDPAYPLEGRVPFTG